MSKYPYTWDGGWRWTCGNKNQPIHWQWGDNELGGGSDPPPHRGGWNLPELGGSSNELRGFNLPNPLAILSVLLSVIHTFVLWITYPAVLWPPSSPRPCRVYWSAFLSAVITSFRWQWAGIFQDDTEVTLSTSCRTGSSVQDGTCRRHLSRGVQWDKRTVLCTGASIPPTTMALSPFSRPFFLPPPKTIFGHCILCNLWCVFSVNFGSCRSGIMTQK